jgi:hypothetical protein
MDNDEKSIYKSVYKAMHNPQDNAVTSIGKIRDDMVEAGSTRSMFKATSMGSSQ